MYINDNIASLSLLLYLNFMGLPNPNFKTFLTTYQQHHSPFGVETHIDKTFIQYEKLFLGSLGIGIFETYQFLYGECRDAEHFIEWLINIKGQATVNQAEYTFNTLGSLTAEPIGDILTKVQRDFWNRNGYLKISGLIPDADCDAVTNLICNTLAVDLSNSKSWYPEHQLLQGLMLQLYQDEALSKIRESVSVRKVFSDLYGSNNIIANCEKVSYNPPENDFFKFMGSPLHWDIDFSIGPTYHIQGLIYLDDVPVERGAFTLIPRFHHKLSDFLRKFDTPDDAIAFLRQTGKVIPLAGKKGDLIVWLESIPHAASPNHSTLPRFVQYVSFTCPEKPNGEDDKIYHTLD